jgi:subtilisin family serine protease
MKALMAAAAIACCALLPAGAASGQPTPAASSSAAASARQILVMLPMAPEHFHAGAGYGGNYPSDASGPARRRLAQAVARKHKLRVVDHWPMPVIGVDCFVMEREGGVPTEQLLQALARDPRVAWAQPVNQFHGLSGGDPLYPIQPSAKYWHLAELHRLSTGRGVRIAVVDSGVDAGHPDLAGQVEVQENFVDANPTPAETHGTAVAGVVAARADDGVGIAGVAPEARLMALRACWQQPGLGTRCSSFTLGKALNFAIAHGARIINLSLAGPGDRLLQTLVDTAVAHGATVVGAVDPGLPGGGFPASVASVLPVAAQAPRIRPLPENALLAPGADIPTCLPGARWALVSGASYATAHVTGLVALLAQLQPQASPAQLKHNILLVRATPAFQKTAEHIVQDGIAGSIDACATIARAAGACSCSCPAVGPSTPGPSR